MRQFLGKEQQMVLVGTVEDDRLHVKVDGKMQMDKKIPWTDEVIGLYRQEKLFQEQKPKPGDSFTYLSYEPTVDTVVIMRVTAKDVEEVEVFNVKKRLLRVEGVPDKLQVQSGSVQLPRSVWWLDKDFQLVRSQTDIPGLGQMVLYRTTQAVASAPAAEPAKMTDIGLSNTIFLNRRIAGARRGADRLSDLAAERRRARHRLRRDRRQEVKNARDKSFELHVQRCRPGPVDDPDAKAPEEFLASNYFLNSADAKVQELARRAVGKETDPWKKAQLIERWVHTHMRAINFTEAMATADHVAHAGGRLQRVLDADRGDVQGRGGAGAGGHRPGLRRDGARAGPGVSHVDRGLGAGPVGGARRHAGPGRYRRGSSEDHRSQLVRNPGDDAVAAGHAGDARQAERRGDSRQRQRVGQLDTPSPKRQQGPPRAALRAGGGPAQFRSQRIFWVGEDSTVG